MTTRATSESLAEEPREGVVEALAPLGSFFEKAAPVGECLRMNPSWIVEFERVIEDLIEEIPICKSRGCTQDTIGRVGEENALAAKLRILHFNE